MNRRNFFKSLVIGIVGAVVAPKVVAEIIATPSKINQKYYTYHSTSPNGEIILGYTGRTNFETGYVMCPYIPIVKV